MKRNTMTKYMAGIAAAAMLCACSDFTEIDQKGLNTLSRVSDLDMLLNAECPFLKEVDSVLYFI